MKTGYSLNTGSRWVGIAALMVSLAPIAMADKATPAPISFSDKTVTRSQASYAVQPAPNSAPAIPQTLRAAPLEANAKTRRLEFRYPDQPDTYYSADGSRAADSSEAPLAFSSATSAITPAAAGAISVASDPAILAGGFDAKAAAAKIALQQSAEAAKTVGKPIRIASLTHQAPAVVAKPFTISRVQEQPDATLSTETGKASIYSAGFDGHPTANGEVYDATALTAAHRTLPLPSLVHVTNPVTQKEIVVRVNDRGPFDGEHILELSPRAGQMLGLNGEQSAEITLRYLGTAPVKTTETFANRVVEDESLPALESFTPAPKPLQAKAVAFQPQTDSGIFIQAGSFSDISNAQRLSSTLSPFHAVKIEEARVNGSDYFRVIVGPFSNRGEADYQRQQMAYDGLANGFVTTR